MNTEQKQKDIDFIVNAFKKYYKNKVTEEQENKFRKILNEYEYFSKDLLDNIENNFKKFDTALTFLEILELTNNRSKMFLSKLSKCRPMIHKYYDYLNMTTYKDTRMDDLVDLIYDIDYADYLCLYSKKSSIYRLCLGYIADKENLIKDNEEKWVSGLNWLKEKICGIGLYSCTIHGMECNTVMTMKDKKVYYKDWNEIFSKNFIKIKDLLDIINNGIESKKISLDSHLMIAPIAGDYMIDDIYINNGELYITIYDDIEDRPL